MEAMESYSWPSIHFVWEGVVMILCKLAVDKLHTMYSAGSGLVSDTDFNHYTMNNSCDWPTLENSLISILEINYCFESK